MFCTWKVEKGIAKCEELFLLLENAKAQGFSIGKYDFLRFLEKVKSGKSVEIKELLNHPLKLKIRKKRWSRGISVEGKDFWILF